MFIAVMGEACYQCNGAGTNEFGEVDTQIQFESKAEVCSVIDSSSQKFTKHVPLEVLALLSVLCQTDYYSLAGEFFPEAAQIAYKMWELSATTKVQVWAPVC